MTARAIPDVAALQPHPYQGCALPLSYRGDRAASLVFSRTGRKGRSGLPCRTVQNDSQTRSAGWEIAGSFVPESSALRLIQTHDEEDLSR